VRLNFGEFSRKWGGFDFSKNKTSVNRLAYAIYTPQKKTQMAQYGVGGASGRGWSEQRHMSMAAFAYL